MEKPNQTTEKDPRDLRDHAGQAHGQEDGRGPATQVNYSAGLDPEYNPGGESSPGNPMDDAMAIRGMFGAMHNELNEVNSNIVEQSSGLKARQINKEVMDRDILNLVGRPGQTNMGQGGIDIAASQNVPYAMNASGIGVTQPTPTDPNQIEFNFDNSATAQDILNKLDDVEKKVTRFSKDLKHITELLEKKK
jgi:hypothetical protein